MIKLFWIFSAVLNDHINLFFQYDDGDDEDDGVTSEGELGPPPLSLALFLEHTHLSFIS